MKTKEILKIIPLWKQEKLKFVKSSTVSNYFILYNKHILPLLQEQNQLNNKVMQQWCFNMIESGLSVKTIKCILVVLNNIIKFCAEAGAFDYCKLTVKFPTKCERKQICILTKQQHKQILSYITRNFNFKNLGIYICLCCGLRIGEVCALKWCDIDLQKQVVIVNKTIQRVYCFENSDYKTKLVEGLPKTVNSFREVPLNCELTRMLKGLIKYVNADYYIISNSASPAEPRSYRNYYKEFMKMLGMPNIKFHSLRHSFATRCIESNCDYKTLSVLLGHSSITTTLNLYAHPNLEQKRKCVNRMLKSLQ